MLIHLDDLYRNIAFDSDESSGGDTRPDGQDNRVEDSGESIDYSKIDISKIPLELITRHPKYLERKAEAEKYRKTNADLRKRLEQDDNNSDKQPVAAKSEKSDTVEPDRLQRLEQMLGDVLKERYLAEALKRLNVDEKGNPKQMLTEKHLKFITGNTVEEMIASGKEVIQTFELDKKTLDAGAGGKNAAETMPFGKIDVKGRLKNRLVPTSNNPFDPTLHNQKGGF